MASDIYNTPDHQAFRETVRRFVDTELRPRARVRQERAVGDVVFALVDDRMLGAGMLSGELRVRRTQAAGYRMSSLI